MEKKICLGCSREFTPKRITQNRGKYCSRLCFNKSQKRLAICHPDKKHVGRGLCNTCLSKENFRRYKYGISLNQYNDLVFFQNNLCAICGNPETKTYKGQIKPLSVDHNHTTGDIRGLLCDNCNNALGRFRDNVTFINQAASYLSGIGGRKYTLDQYSLVPTMISSVEHRQDADTALQFGPINLGIPILAAPMPDVCGDHMASTLNRLKAYGIIHRFQSKEDRIIAAMHGSAGVAIGLNEDYMDIVRACRQEGVEIFCIDTANGASIRVREAVGRLKDKYPDIFIIVGNIASGQAFRGLEEFGADAIRVNIGTGRVCLTTNETGIYNPTGSLLLECYRIRRRALIICDGGISSPAQMCKALAFGADVVMMGGALAGTKESPGEILKIDGKLYKKLRGAASFSTQKENTGEEPNYVEGAETLVEYKGSVEKVISRFAAGLRSSMSYMNARTLTEYRANVKIVEIA